MTVELTSDHPLPSIQVKGNDITFSLTDLKKPITGAEAQADWRKLFFALLDHFAEYHNGLDLDNRSKRMSIYKTGRLEADNTLEHNYSVNVTTSIISEQVKAEP